MGSVMTEAFPAELLVGCEEGLVLFAAAFGGAQDARFLADAGLRATCVDIDKLRLDAMRPDYPPDWNFVYGDAFEFATLMKASRRRWDVVTVDCPTNLFPACSLAVDLWCSLARELVVLGCAADTFIDPSEPWRETDRRKRSNYAGGVFWSVIES